MEQTNSYPYEYMKPFLPCLNLLSMSALRLFTNKKKSRAYRWHSLFVATCIIIWSIALPYKVIYGNLEILLLANMILISLITLQGILKGIWVATMKSDIEALIKDVGAIWRKTDLAEEQEIKKKSLLKTLHRSNSTYYWIHIIGMWQYTLTPFCETIFRIFILKQEYVLSLPYACAYPFDPTETWIAYIAAYISQIFGSAEMLMITLCAHLSIEMALLQHDLLHVKPTSNTNETHGAGATNVSRRIAHLDNGTGLDLKDIVKRHQKLIMLCKRLDDIFNIMVFIDLLFAAIIICFFGFVANFTRSPADMLRNVVGLMACICALYNLSYYGELLKSNSEEIAKASYESLWYECSASHQKAIAFIIYRAQKPCCLTSLKYAPTSLNTFSRVLGTTWSYYTLASTLYEGK